MTRPEGAPGQSVHEHEELLDRLVHDLRNPLGVIAYFAELVSGASAADRTDLCERLRINAQRALHILEEFSLLAELRTGACIPALEPCDVAEMAWLLTAELESLERRPGQMQCKIDVRPTALPRAHLTCTLRALLRAAMRASAREDALELCVHIQGRLMLFVIDGPLRVEPGTGTAARLSAGGVEIELAERMARLYRGHCGIELHGARGVITLALPCAG
jgi:signal transduction histidine kinase